MLKPTFILLALCAGAVSARDFSCRGREDNYYVYGCSNSYFHCVSGRTHIEKCPEDMFYNPEKYICDNEENVNACNNPKKYKNKLLFKKTTLSCKGKKDGQYADEVLKCDYRYYTCLSERKQLRYCPSELFFDAKTKNCETKERVKACKGWKNRKISGDVDEPAPPGYNHPYASIEEIKDTQVAASPPASPPAAYQEELIDDTQDRTGAPVCGSVGDGVYADSQSKCVSHFWKCANEKLFRYRCPEDLFYDAERDRCDYKLNVPGCGGQRVTVVAADVPMPTPAAISYDCTGKEDGFYTIERCSHVFFHCLNKVVRQLQCNDGLSFDTRINLCDYPEACKGERNETAPVPLFNHGSLQLPAQAAPEVTFDCQGKSNGKYGTCKPQYFECIDGKSTALNCPEGLVFNKLSSACDYAPSCREGSTTTVYTTTTTTTYTTTPYVTTPAPVTPTPTVAPSPVESTPTSYSTSSASSTSCTGLSNGPHPSEACSSDYLECWDEVATAAKCPHDLIFNPHNKQCDYEGNVHGCNNGAPVPPPTTTTVSPPTIAQGPVEPFCERLADGNYGKGCNMFYYSCTDRVTIKINCPSGLYYNVQTSMCSDKSEVLACGALVTPVPVATTARPTLPVRETEFDCIGKKDGLFAFPDCTASFIQCYNGQTIQQRCQEGLFYNEVNGMCDYKEHVATCGGRLPDQAQPSYSSQALVSSPAAPTFNYVGRCVGKTDGYYALGCSSKYFSCSGEVETRHNCPSDDLKFCKSKQTCDYPEHVKECQNEPTCEDKDDGFYSTGCSSKYYSCSSGKLTTHICPSGLRYSTKSGNCEYNTEVPECSKSGEIVVGTAAVDGLKNEKILGYVPIESDKNLCVGKPDGFYGKGCSQSYYSCSSEVVTQLGCPPELRFIQSLARCDYPSSVPECGGTLPPKMIVKLDRPTVQAPEFTCKGKTDGFYSDGCGSTYFSCIGGAPSVLACPDGLKFAQSQSRCDYSGSVEECGGTPTVFTSAAPVKDDVTFSCQNKQDGYYSHGCSRVYFSCITGVSSKLTCQEGLRFSKSSLRCEWPKSVPECGGSAPDNTPAKRPTDLPSYNCAGKNDGYYAVAPCSENFASCLLGVATIGRCASSLKYNTVTGSCDHSAKILACNQKSTIRETAPPAPPTVAAAPQTSAMDLCAGKPDGRYSLGECASEFLQCTNGLATKTSCPAGTFMNPSMGYCDLPNRIAACSAAQPPVAAPPPAFTCLGKADGVYGISCQKNFFRCVSTTAYPYQCPAGLVFDVSTGVCNYPSYVQGC